MNALGASLKTGLPELDELIQIGTGIVTLRTSNYRRLSQLTCNLLARNLVPGKKILYLSWVDYHQRFWTIDFDAIIGTGKKVGADVAALMKDVLVVRFFSRDNVECEDNWKKLFALKVEINLVVLDSANEIFETGEKHECAKPFSYSLCQFVRLCMLKNCVGVVLDSSAKPLHPFMGNVSSIIIKFDGNGSQLASIVKHAFHEETAFELSSKPQKTLHRWLA